MGSAHTVIQPPDLGCGCEEEGLVSPGSDPVYDKLWTQHILLPVTQRRTRAPGPHGN